MFMQENYIARKQHLTSADSVARRAAARSSSANQLLHGVVPGQRLVPVGAYQHHLAMTRTDANLGRQYFMNHE